MVISIDKTKVLHVREQEPTSTTTANEAVKVCKFSCPHHLCTHQFLTKHGMLVHAGKCDHRNIHPMDKITEHKGTPYSCKYRVR